jgi:hypothetical protein
MEHFNSEWWFTPFERMADAFYNNADRELVIYRKDAFDTIKQKYGNRLLAVKTNMYGQGAENSNGKTDHHKIIALYVQLFSENPIFVVKEPKSGIYPSAKTIFINEHYCLDIMYSVLKSWTKKAFDFKKFDEYKINFMKLLANYRKSHAEAIREQPHFSYTQVDKYPQHFHFTYALAHIVYFIERNFMN